MKKTSLQLLKKYFLFFALLVSSFKSFAQAPANDDCSGAVPVSTFPYSDMGGTYTKVNTFGATRSTPDPSCITSSDNNDDVWYKFVAVTQVELLRVQSAVNGTYTTFGYALYDGCGGTEITCSNIAGPFTDKALLGGLTPGNTYYIRFWSQHNFTFFSFAFCVQDITPITPSNEAVTATALTINDPGTKCIAPQFYTTASATRSSPNPSCTGDNDDDIWFQFIQPLTNSVFILIEQGVENTTGAFGTLGMEIIDATNGLTASCNANYPAGSVSLFGGAPGRMYYLRIWARGVGTPRVTFSMCLQQGNVFPPNDSCASATQLTVQNGSCSSSTIGNLANSNITAGMTANPVCAQPNPVLKNDVWYKVTVPSTGNAVIQTSATHTAVNDLVMQAYTGSCGALTEIACDEDGNPDPFPSDNHSRISLSGRTPGETVYIRVLPRNGRNMGQFAICAFDETAVQLPQININDTNIYEGNTGNQKIEFTVTLSKASADTVKVSYKTKDVTAVAPTDYITIDKVLNFNPGQKTKKLRVTIKGDTTVENNETFKVKLSNPVHAIFADSVGIGKIKNDDSAPFAAAAGTDEATAETNRTAKIYPNPVTDILHLNLTGADAQTITVTDVTGKIFKLIKTMPGEKNISIGTDNLNSGIYLLKIQSGKENMCLKFVKE